MTYFIDRRRIEFQHIAFATLLMAIFLTSIIVGTINSGPIILGTEMNTNGHVEYLCLGNGCENMHDFQWSDK